MKSRMFTLNHLYIPVLMICIHVQIYLFPFVLVDLESLHSDWLTGVVNETMHHAFGP